MCVCVCSSLYTDFLQDLVLLGATAIEDKLQEVSTARAFIL